MGGLHLPSIKRREGRGQLRRQSKPKINDSRAYVANITRGIIDSSTYVVNMTRGIIDSGTYVVIITPKSLIPEPMLPT